jgi:hypothetical protein
MFTSLSRSVGALANNKRDRWDDDGWSMAMLCGKQKLRMRAHKRLCLTARLDRIAHSGGSEKILLSNPISDYLMEKVGLDTHDTAALNELCMRKRVNLHKDAELQAFVDHLWQIFKTPGEPIMKKTEYLDLHFKLQTAFLRGWNVAFATKMAVDDWKWEEKVLPMEYGINEASFKCGLINFTDLWTEDIDPGQCNVVLKRVYGRFADLAGTRPLGEVKMKTRESIRQMQVQGQAMVQGSDWQPGDVVARLLATHPAVQLKPLPPPKEEEDDEDNAAGGGGEKKEGGEEEEDEEEEEEEEGEGEKKEGWKGGR